jgi:predicted RNase H-like HicB family nuclease
MAHYIAFLDSGKDGKVGAWVPDAPGCTAMGADAEEAIANITEALREWMADYVADGRERPAARGLAALRADPKADADLVQSAVHVPLLLDAGRTVRANISVDAGLLEQIDEAAKRRGLTRSSFLAAAARSKIVESR